MPNLLLTEKNICNPLVYYPLFRRFRFSISLVSVRELTLNTLLKLTPCIIIPILGLFFGTVTKDGAREREFTCFGMHQIIIEIEKIELQNY